ncbi:MAG: F0F1 ATP synthase subunit delta [Rikenellaceae bacterium]|nr:F0F1 ATP synthase subunit delta [Rikenellaceae bacterium]MCL2693233.1 F0F1 ATP synthase subunit delta [Rikenellaceae bacterium]
MNEGFISRRYAKALMAYAHELGEEQALYERMRVLAQGCVTVPQLMHTICNPMVTPAQKSQLIRSAGGEGGAEKSYDAFVRVVRENHRERLVLNIALAYMKLYRAAHNISIISITSARPMSHELHERIRRDIIERTHGEAEIELHIDESLDGGFIIQIDDRRLDASVKGQLAKIRRQLMSGGKSLGWHARAASLRGL